LNVWENIGPEGGTINVIVIDPHIPTTLYAGTKDNSIFKSIDGGAHWSMINDGVIFGEVKSLAIDPQTPTTIYAGGLRSILYKSVDGGQSWVRKFIWGYGEYLPCCCSLSGCSLCRSSTQVFIRAPMVVKPGHKSLTIDVNIVRAW
jgi:hypothetical protein